MNLLLVITKSVNTAITNWYQLHCLQAWTKDVLVSWRPGRNV